MGILSKLLKVGAGVAAPFTGGASLAAIPAIDAFGKAAGGGAQAMASNRGTKAELLMDSQKALEEQLLARELEKRQAGSDAYKKSIMASLAANWQSPSGPPGVTPVRFGGPNGPGNDMNRMAGGEMFGQSMRRLLQPDLVNPTGMPAYQSMMDNPAFKKTMNPGILEKLLGIASVAAPVAGMFGGDDDDDAFTPRSFSSLNR